MSAACPIDGIQGRAFLEVDGFAILECPACRHRFLEFEPQSDHTAHHYGDRYFHEGGAGYADYEAGEELLIERGRFYAGKLAGHCPRPGRLLDVGCAAGYLMRGFASRGWNCEGVEPNRAMAERAESAGMRTYRGGIEDCDPEGLFDVVSMVQVVAHIRDLAAAFSKVADLLNPGGKVLIETWNSASWTARLLKKLWHEYSPPTVLNWFTRTSLRNLAEAHGFTQIDTRLTVKKVAAGHVASILRHKAGHSRILRPIAKVAECLPGRLAIPYPADDLFWALFEKTGCESHKSVTAPGVEPEAALLPSI